jgi:uncharacterized membrane protein
MLTPIVRVTKVLDWLPDPIEAYFKPIAQYSGFTLLPWGGFVLAGAATGLWLDTARTPRDERRVIVWLALLGPALVATGYALSLLPPIYRETNFWTSSPTFFVLRVGVLIAAIAIGYAWTAAVRGRSPIQELGIASFFVYWIHVEMVYGFLTWPIHRRLTFEQALVAFACSPCSSTAGQAERPDAHRRASNIRLIFTIKLRSALLGRNGLSSSRCESVYTR